MTNREKAERCGEFVRGVLSAMRDVERIYPGLQRNTTVAQDQAVESARQAGHWGRLALAEKVAL